LIVHSDTSPGFRADPYEVRAIRGDREPQREWLAQQIHGKNPKVIELGVTAYAQAANLFGQGAEAG